MDAIKEKILAPYGEILGIKGMKTSHARLSALNGTREVLLRTDEIHKQRIPHLIKFNSGQSVLIIMAGRQPLCLKCHDLGHVRRDCPTNRSFSGLNTRQVEVTGSQGRSAGVASAGPTAGVEPVSSDTVAYPNPPLRVLLERRMCGLRWVSLGLQTLMRRCWRRGGGRGLGMRVMMTSSRQIERLR